MLSGYFGRLGLGVVGLTAMALAHAVTADIVYLVDGTWIRGTITKETNEDLEIDGKTNTGITYKGVLNKNRVSSIVRTDSTEPAKPDQKADPKDGAKPDQKTEPKAKEVAGDFLVVPLRGTFGEDIHPRGVDMSLDWAIKKGVKHVVFMIDSPGGKVWAAQAINESIKAREGKVTCHVVIERALSASIWVVFACDKIGVVPGATLGAAVAFKTDDSGNAEVDEKFNSAIAGTLASDAERLGHSGELVRSMVLTDQKLYAVKTGENWKFAHDRPASAADADVETLNDGNRVVTLTTEQMVKYKVATKMVKKADADIATFLGDAAFKGSGNIGELNMKQAQSASTAFIKQLDNWAVGVLKAGALWKAAVKEDDADKAVRAVEDYLRQLRRVGPLRSQAKELGLLAYPALKRIDVETDVKAAEEDLIRLKELRRKRNGG